MTLPKIYENNELRVVVNDNFIYCCEVYLLWKNGASLVDTKYFASQEPIKIKKKKRKKEQKLVKFITLEFAPEEWLRNNNFKLIN